jgi:mannan endo-1,4-beta-mannosidase
MALYCLVFKNNNIFMRRTTPECMSLRIVFPLLIIFLVAACGTNRAPGYTDGEHPGTDDTVLSDPDATPLAAVLFANLAEVAREHVLLGHQDALAYGMGWAGDTFRTDINDVLGDHPAVFGWDLGHMGDERNIDGVPFSGMKAWARAVYDRGGVNTYSWHMRNYAVTGTAWDTDPCVEACLPGGTMEELYREKLDQAADFFSSLRTETGELIPVLFRPFHEMTGGWFWWGNGNCSAGQYKDLFRYTVDYLRKEKGMHQLIMVYSTDVFSSAAEYMQFYPGDGYVDVMAFDDYHSVVSPESIGPAIRMLEILDSLSAAHGKLMAISETGQETIPNDRWFTKIVLPILNASPSTRKAAWVLFWRNGRPDHFYAPYPGHPAAADFRVFMDDPLMLSLSELPSLYHLHDP